ncbi:acyltransferase [Janibacter sp. DB-40]|uniref:acyltransferase family protein n=1 Tax=Janibacter sp. DB-40 TaxID=3028808 RepID=UPI00240548A0|nr:acyltransferase [Janibacter sp. DB-40]
MTAGVTARSHWPGLDGLRGIAALAVLLFHAQLGLAVNGYVGVDVFFALSGFLITSILLGELHRHGRLRLIRFYGRRVLRLYPALLVTCVLVVVAGLITGNLTEVGPGAAAALVYLGNWWMYTGHPAVFLEHTWTLAIEEHFYAVWPLLLVVLFSSRRWVRALGVSACLVLIAVLFSPWPESIEPVRGTYLRGFPIVWGSLLAWLAQRGPFAHQRQLGVAANIALAALLVVLLAGRPLPERWLTGPDSITAVLTVIVLAGVVLAPSSWTGAALAKGPLRWAGTRSYGMYLYHFPLLQLLRHQVDVGPVWVRMLLGIVVTLLVTEASFRWIETPFLRLKDRLDDRAAARTEIAQPAPAGEAPV